MEECLITSFLRDEFRSLPALSFVDRGETFSYADLAERIGRTIAFLHRHGVKKGDYVLVALPAVDHFFTSLVALMSRGAVAVPVNADLADEELGKIASLIPIRFTLTDHRFLSRHIRSLSSLQGVRALLTVDPATDRLPERLSSLQISLTPSGPGEAVRLPGPRQIVTCHFTLKGMGRPLGVEHAYDDYCQTVRGCDRIFQIRPGTKVLTLLPSYPVFGLVANLFVPLAKGCELVIPDKKKGGILKAIIDHGIDRLNAVPAILESMLHEAERQGVSPDLSRLGLVVGASYVTPELHERFQKTFNLAPTQGYGLTETLPVLANNPRSPRPGTLGTPVRPGVELRICDARGFRVPRGRAGEICLRGRGVITRYIGGEGTEEILFRKRWLRTGDLGFLDDDGNVVFVGRRLGFTKILGHMVDFKEVEDTCRQISGVKAARGTVVQDQGREKLSLSLLVSRDSALSRKDVIDHCRKALSPFKVPEIIKIFKMAYEEVP